MRNRSKATTCPSSLQAGFSLLELLISVAILLVVGGTIMMGMLQMTKTQGTIVNRTQVHSSVRAATELLQQEIGQAGRITLPACPGFPSVQLTGAVAPSTLPQAVGVNCTTAMFQGEWLVIDAGQNQESVALTVDPAGNQITAVFSKPHLAGVPVNVQGGFATGVVPSVQADLVTAYPNGSSGNKLKLYGDINGDGNMVYLVYTCDTQAGVLYRNMQPMFTTLLMPANDQSMVVIDNLQPNPDGSPCFSYQTKAVGTTPYVVNVAMTLTVQTQARDPQTGQFQRETKALLNVGPRNVFDTWELANNGNTNRVQPMPQAITNLLPQL